MKVGGSSLGVGCDRALAEEGPGVLAAMLVVVEVVVWVFKASHSDSVQEVDCILCQQFSQKGLLVHLLLSSVMYIPK